MHYGRDNRWAYLGLVNEPCFTKATGPDPNRYGLWLDVRDPTCPPDPFANEAEVSGRADRRARQDGAASARITASRPAIVGLRLFPNPDFDESRAEALGLGALLQRSELLRVDAIWSGRTASACRAPSATSDRIRSSRRPTPRTRVGEPELERRRAVLLGGPHLRLAGRRRTRAASSTSCSTRRARARSTRRSSRPTTSTTRGR